MLGLSFLPDVYQGMIVMAAGLVLLLHTLGIFERGLSYLLVAGAIYMIVIGFVKFHGVEKIRAILERKHHKKH